MNILWTFVNCKYLLNRSIDNLEGRKVVQESVCFQSVEIPRYCIFVSQEGMFYNNGIFHAG